MDERKRHWTVPSEEARVRLDHYLTRRMPEQSRSQIQLWIRKGRVQVNERPAKSGYLLRSGDEITVQQEMKPSAEPHPEAIPLKVLYQDQDLAVIDKPAGLVCHIGAGVRSGTLVNALLYALGPLEGGDPARPGIVHRLDKQTSGVMVVAKNTPTHRALSEQFKRRSVAKKYTALVFGMPNPSMSTIDVPLGRDPKNRKKISAHARRRRNAVTHYRVQKQYGPLSLLAIEIETGRTHQIRAHLSHVGHPVVGDTLYGGNLSRGLKDPRLRQTIAELRRPFLHAEKLEFEHPASREKMSFSAPLPQELADFLVRVESLVIADM